MNIFDYFVISQRNILYQCFQLTLTNIAIISSLMYAYFAAFRYDREQRNFADYEQIGLDREIVRRLDRADFIFEMFYFIDFIIQFFVEYKIVGS